MILLLESSNVRPSTGKKSANHQSGIESNRVKYLTTKRVITYDQRKINGTGIRYQIHLYPVY